MLYFCLALALTVIAVLAPRLFFYRRRIQALKKQFKTTENQLIKEIEKEKYLQTQLTELQRKLSNSVTKDPLTQLPSRKVFEDRLELIINQSARYQTMCAVMFLDIDGFKVINDALGYDVGDELLKEVSRRLNECVRKVDTVSHFGGDEFIFIFPQIGKPEAAAYVAQRLLNSISQPFHIQESDLYLTASIGITFYPADGVDGKALLINADNALHQAKLHGRNSYQFYREDMYAVSRRELVLCSSLRSDSVYNDFTIHYQPQVHVEQKKIICMSAMLQWKHADFGEISFDEFVRLAESCGKMAVFSEWMLRTVSQHLKQWCAHGFTPQAVSIPLSLKQLENSHFIHTVSHILHELELAPENIIFEISEMSLAVRVEQIEKMLHMMRHLGVRIAINNFGAGALPLQYLRRLPVNIYKIDGTLVQDISVNKENELIVKMIIALAKSLQIDVIVEGIDNAAQKKVVMDLGCGIIQGDIFGPPGLASDFMDKVVEGVIKEKA